jgi:hypothetical protein
MWWMDDVNVPAVPLFGIGEDRSPAALSGGQVAGPSAG